MLFDYSKLAPEIQCKIIDCATIAGKNSKESAFIINALSLTNQQLNAEINKPRYADNLIKKLAAKYYCSHETIAKRLCIKPARERLTLQGQLKTLCCHPHSHTTPDLHEKLHALIIKGVDSEFTYNHDHQQKTALMIAMSCNKNMLAVLLNHGANINACNAFGMTALHFACKKNRIAHVKTLFTYPQLAINQHNNNGENALLYCLIHRKQFTKRFFNLCKMLLQAGLDPECTNKKGINPVLALKAINNLHDTQPTLYLLNNAIQEKHDSIDLKL
jgi:hypothetical protein